MYESSSCWARLVLAVSIWGNVWHFIKVYLSLSEIFIRQVRVERFSVHAVNSVVISGLVAVLVL